MCTKEIEFKCILFALCYFHAVVAERRKFGAQGWNRSYPFNNGDLTISINVLYNYLEANPKVGAGPRPSAALPPSAPVCVPSSRGVSGVSRPGGRELEAWPPAQPASLIRRLASGPRPRLPPVSAKGQCFCLWPRSPRVRCPGTWAGLPPGNPGPFGRSKREQTGWCWVRVTRGRTGRPPIVSPEGARAEATRLRGRERKRNAPGEWPPAGHEGTAGPAADAERLQVWGRARSEGLGPPVGGRQPKTLGLGHHPGLRAVPPPPFTRPGQDLRPGEPGASPAPASEPREEAEGCPPTGPGLRLLLWPPKRPWQAPSTSLRQGEEDRQPEAEAQPRPLPS